MKKKQAVKKTKKKLTKAQEKELEEFKMDLLSSTKRLHILLEMTEILYTPEFKDVLGFMTKRCQEKKLIVESEKLSQELMKQLHGKNIISCVLATSFLLSSVMSNKEPLELFEKIKQMKVVSNYIQ